MTTETTGREEGQQQQDGDQQQQDLDADQADQMRRMAEACDALIHRTFEGTDQTALYLAALDRVRADPVRLRALLGVLQLLKALAALDVPTQTASRAAAEREAEDP